MLKVYCSQCGSPTSYSAAKPKFCSGCGRSFDGTIINKVQNQQPTIIKREPIKKIIPKIQPKAQIENYDDGDDYEGEEINHVPEISRLDCEISESKPRGVKIKDLAGTSNDLEKLTEPNSNIKSKKMSKSEKKKAALSILKEGASIRTKK
jgi:hypothetical protein